MNVLENGSQNTGLWILAICVALALVIFLVRRFGRAAGGNTEAVEPVAAPEQVSSHQSPAIDAIDPQVIAAIAAAIAAFDNSGKALVVRSVRRVSAWNKAARDEQVYRF